MQRTLDEAVSRAALAVKFTLALIQPAAITWTRHQHSQGTRMPKYEEVAGKVFWVAGTLFVAVLMIGIGEEILNDQYPELLQRDPIPVRKVERKVSMPPIENIRLVLDRDEVRNPGDRVKKAWKECVFGSPPGLIQMGGGSRIEEFLADATETDVFYFHCSPVESWERLAGRSGLVKVRDGKAVDELLFYMN